MIKKLLILSVLGALLLGIITIIMSSPNYVFAQSVDTAWVRRYNGPASSDDSPSAIAVDKFGNIYVTGGSAQNNIYPYDYDFATIKYNSSGTQQWIQRYNGPANNYDIASGIAVDGSGNVYVTGGSDGDSTLFDYTTIKYKLNGDTAWVRRYNGSSNGGDYSTAIAIDTLGNVYVTGASDSVGATPDYVTIKYKSNGDAAWAKRYSGFGYFDAAYAIAVDGSGNVYVTGRSDGPGTGEDYATIKYYSNGDTAWIRRYNGPGNIATDEVHAIAVDRSGNVIVTGSSIGSGSDYDYATIKYLPNGDTAWIRRYNGSSNDYDYAYALIVDGSNNVYVTGKSYSIGTSEDYVTIKYYPNGDTAWVRRYNGPGNGDDVARAIAIDTSGNVYVTGESFGSNEDYATIKYDSSGNKLWETRYNGPANSIDAAYAIAVDGSVNVYVTGRSMDSLTDFDYATIKYVQTPGEVKDETGNREKPSEFTLSQNYPNPFNQSTKLEFTLSHSGFVSLTIYDLLGRRIRTLVLENLTPGYKSVVWDGKDNSGKEIASGIYFYQLKVGDFSEAKKLVLLK